MGSDLYVAGILDAPENMRKAREEIADLTAQIESRCAHPSLHFVGKNAGVACDACGSFWRRTRSYHPTVTSRLVLVTTNEEPHAHD